jgi:LysM repeat protein
VGIGGGNSSVTQGQTPTPVLITQVAQDGPNPQQATATAAIATFQAAQTQTAAAQQGIILPTNTLLPDGSGGGLVSTPAPTQAFPDCPHYVQPDTTLGSIARTYNLTVTELAAYNNITNPDFIKAGDTIIIPGCGRRPTATPTLNLTPGQGGAAQASNPLDNSLGPIRYVVQPGDNLYRLSVRFGVTMSEILNANPRITDINVLSVGWELIIPIRSRPLTTPTPTLPVTS